MCDLSRAWRGQLIEQSGGEDCMTTWLRMLNNEYNSNDATCERDWRLRLNKVNIEVCLSTKHVTPNTLELLNPFFVSTCQADWAVGRLSNASSMAEVVRAQVDDGAFFK
jgi:hypothetical protein